MKKAAITICLTCLVAFVLFQGNSDAEPYTGKDFPTDAQLINTIRECKKPDQLEYLGKIKKSEHSYTCYFFTLSKGSIMPRELAGFEVVHLDTGIWMISCGHHYTIIQK